jgi:hypothetical protein
MIAVLLGLGLLIALPQSNASTATASLEGYVREGGSRAPIPHARVRLAGAGVREATTADNQGHFAFSGLGPGRYALVVDIEGFAFDPVAASIPILVAGRTAVANVEMVRAGVITGEVRDDQGNPRSGLSVTPIRKVDTGGTELPRLPPTFTNGLGEFRLDGLLPGEYLVLASPPPERTPSAAVMPTYFPGVTELKSATTVAVAAGQTVTGIFVTMQSAPAFDISGTVIDEQGRPRRALIVFVSQSLQTWVPNQSSGLQARVTALTTRADGTFRIRGLGPGSYRLTPLTAPDTPPQPLPPNVMTAAVNGNRSTLQVDVRNADVHDVTIVFRNDP